MNEIVQSFPSAASRGTSVLLVAIALSSTLSAQLDDSWTVKVGGQTVRVNPDGSFRVPNINAADAFGAGGPGTLPDFVSDDSVRVVAVQQLGGHTLYAFSTSFRLRSGESTLVPPLVVTNEPPPIPEEIAIGPRDRLVRVGDSIQLEVTATLADGSDIDVTGREAFTLYRYGYAAAFSLVIFLILLVFLVIWIRRTRATEAAY